MKILSKIFSRTTFMVLMAILEILFVYSLVKWFNDQVAWIDGVLTLLSVVIVLMIIKDSRHLSSDMMWIVGIMLFPIPGTILYLLLGANMLSSKTFKSLKVSTDKAKKYYKQDEVKDAPELPED